jgi:uncharacterized protein YceH (UPF0502 family)
MRTDPVEGRVLGSLIEKQLTTPQQYPLTLNALGLACNQSSNREPVTSFAEGEIEVALSSLKEKGLVRFVLPSHGRSVVRYRHVLDERLALDPRQLALIGVLLLRGHQTVGELRARCERMAEFDSVSQVEADLVGLTRGDTPLVVRLDRRPGQKEERWAQLLSEELDGIGGLGGDGAPTGSGASGSRAGTEVAALREEVAALRAEVEQLKGLVLGL